MGLLPRRVPVPIAWQVHRCSGESLTHITKSTVYMLGAVSAVLAILWPLKKQADSVSIDDSDDGNPGYTTHDHPRAQRRASIQFVLELAQFGDHVTRSKCFLAAPCPPLCTYCKTGVRREREGFTCACTKWNTFAGTARQVQPASKTNQPQQTVFCSKGRVRLRCAW